VVDSLIDPIKTIASPTLDADNTSQMVRGRENLNHTRFLFCHSEREALG